MCPSYSFKDLNTGDEFNAVMTMAEREEYLKTNPNIQQQLIVAPSLGDSVRLGIRKPPDSFRDILREAKKKNSKGLSKSTINTF